MSASPRVAAAYAHCESLTRAQAANFYYGIRLLSGERRRAMCAVYAFSREVDDIGDDDNGLAAEEKLRLLDARELALGGIMGVPAAASQHVAHAAGDGARVALAEPAAPATPREDPVIVALGDACQRFPIPIESLGELIEGVRMDVREVRYERFDELVLYCRRVAGAIGRVCLAIFALRSGVQADRAAAEALADDLGVALQLTNILRDVREDAENGRVYLPFEDLRRFALLAPTGEQGDDWDTGAQRLASLARVAPSVQGEERESLEHLAELVRFEAARAREWFARGGQLASLLDRRSAACLLAMAGIYARLLDRIEARPLEAVSRRMSLPTHEKAWVAARAMLGMGL
jgi:15-cis-phytoene synthase